MRNEILKRLARTGLMMGVLVAPAWAEPPSRVARFQELHDVSADDEAPIEDEEVSPLPRAEIDAFLRKVEAAVPAGTLEDLAGSYRSTDKLVRTPADGDAALLWPFGGKDPGPVTLSRRYNPGQALEYSIKTDARVSVDGKEVERNKFKGNLLQAVLQTDLSQSGMDLYQDVQAALVASEVRQVSGKRWENGDKLYLPGDAGGSSRERGGARYTQSVQARLQYHMVEPSGQIYVSRTAAEAAEGTQLRFLPNPFAVVPDKEIRKGETWQSRPLNGRDHQFLTGCRIQYTSDGVRRRLGGWFGWLFGKGNKCHTVKGEILDPSGRKIGRVDSYIDVASGQLLEEYATFDRKDFDLGGRKVRARSTTHIKFMSVLKAGSEETMVPQKP